MKTVCIESTNVLPLVDVADSDGALLGATTTATGVLTRKGVTVAGGEAIAFDYAGEAGKFTGILVHTLPLEAGKGYVVTVTFTLPNGYQYVADIDLVAQRAKIT